MRGSFSRRLDGVWVGIGSLEVGDGERDLLGYFLLRESKKRDELVPRVGVEERSESLPSGDVALVSLDRLRPGLRERSEVLLRSRSSLKLLSSLDDAGFGNDGSKMDDGALSLAVSGGKVAGRSEDSSESERG